MNQRGMTLVEILIVLTIIAAMASYLVPKLFGQGERAKINESKIKIGQLNNAITTYQMDCGRVPSALEGLVKKDECRNWNPEGYAKAKDLKDGWGQDFVYESKGQSFTIISLGRDGTEGGEGYDADISSEEL
jgi:general secretion pathway protein G